MDFTILSDFIAVAIMLLPVLSTRACLLWGVAMSTKATVIILNLLL